MVSPPVSLPPVKYYNPPHLLLNKHQFLLPPHLTCPGLCPLDTHTLVKLILADVHFGLRGTRARCMLYEPDPRQFIATIRCHHVIRISSRSTDVLWFEFL